MPRKDPAKQRKCSYPLCDFSSRVDNFHKHLKKHPSNSLGTVNVALDLSEVDSSTQRSQEQPTYLLDQHNGRQDSDAAGLPEIRPKKRIRTSSSTYILCIGIPSASDIAKDDLLGIPFDLTDHEVLKSHLGMVIKRESLLKLGETVGPAFVSEHQGEPVLHQAVMTTLLAGALDQVQVEFQNWDWLKVQIKSNKLVEHIQAKSATHALLWISNNNSHWPGLSMSRFYDHMRLVSALCGNLEVCLSETEANWEELKLGDVAALDKIARESETEEFSYRPKTCFGTGKCVLSSTDVEFMVIKRSHSCGAAHVKRVPGSDRGMLECVDVEEEDHGPLRPVSSQKPIWFHQEEVPSLKDFGEFRVFFVRNEIIGAVRTKFEQRGEKLIIATQPLSLDDFCWYSDDLKEREYKMSRLFTHARSIRAELLGRHDANEHYRSLRVAGRLDMGVSKLSREGRFFGGEVARFAGANLFSRLMFRSPYTQLVEMIARGIVEEYGR